MELCRDRGNQLHIVYTALHGTGSWPCAKMLSELGLTRVTQVLEQAQEDGDFSTVTSPNPEDPEALSMAVEVMKKEGGDIVFANDPDADRMGVAVKHKGKICYPNGNQLGTLMLYYILSNLKKRNALPPNPYFVQTVVTTPLQETIAGSFGVKVEKTLTGFKWICRRVNKIERESPERNFIFATEESFGYLHHPFSRDKDGISSIALMAEIALWYKERGMSILDALDEIYQKYGFSAEKLLSFNYAGKEGAQTIELIMDNFRSNPRKYLYGQEIVKIEDYKEGLAGYPPSNILGFHLTGGNLLYLRPSGTEPKIKFYLMVQSRDSTLEENKAKAEEIINHMTAEIKREVEAIELK